MLNTRHIKHRHGALAPVLLLACALLWAQALGLAHGIVHGPQLGSGHGVAQPAAALASDEGGTVVESFWTRLLAAHQADSDCRVFEQLSHADAMPGVPPLALPALAPLSPVIAVAAPLLISLTLPFQARGPPVTR